MDSETFDVIVVGGGPVGLYAGLRSAGLLLRVHVIDKGRKWCRGFHVPMYHNIPTHPDGISGREVINHLRKSISNYKDYGSIEDFVTVDSIKRGDDFFFVEGTHNPTNNLKSYKSRVVVLATGVVDRQPVIGGELKTVFPFANNQLLCYCVICDGHLVYGKEAAVIGYGAVAVRTALDLLYFKAKRVTILTNGEELFKSQDESEERKNLEKLIEEENLQVITEEIRSLFGVEDKVFGVRLSGGSEMAFGIAFSALGFYKVNNDLAVMLGGQIDESGYIVVDGDGRVLDNRDRPIAGLYAVGDVTQNWKQLIAGFGDTDRAVLHAWSEYL